MKASDRTKMGWFDMLDGSLLFIQDWDEDREIAIALGQSEYVDTGIRRIEQIQGVEQEVKILTARPCYVEVPYDLIGDRRK